MMSAQQLDIDAIQAILEERARELARVPEQVDDGDMVQMAIVETGSERYAIDVFYLREVRSAPAITAFPSLPPVWSGLMNLRGALYPVLDLGIYLGAGTDRDGDTFDVAVIQGAPLGIGLLVDRVTEVRKIGKADIGPRIGSAAGVVSGITADMVSVLDVERLLSDPDLAVKDGAA
jgi:purine-binding chemotaxis protein CheW